MISPTLQPRSMKSLWINSVDSLVLCYQGILCILILMGNMPQDQKMTLIGYHAAFSLLLILGLWMVRDNTHPVVRFFRETYLLVFILYFYKEIGVLVHLYNDWTMDEWLVGVDNALGRIGTSVWNLQQFYPPSPWLNEFFSIGYGFFFVLIPLSALVLYFRAPREKFRGFLFTLGFTYFLCYITFIFLPAESPRFYMPGLRESLQGYWFAHWLQTAVEKNAFPGGSFPSSHIAASVITFMCYPYLKKWRIPVLFLTIAMFAGTIYGRYHYFVDVVAGLAVGLVCYHLGPWLEKKWPFIFSEEGMVRERTRQTLNRGGKTDPKARGFTDAEGKGIQDLG